MTEQTETTIGPLAAHFKRKYEAECRESLSLAIALEEAHAKNRNLIDLLEQLRVKPDDENVEIIDADPPTNGKGKGDKPDAAAAKH